VHVILPVLCAAVLYEHPVAFTRWTVGTIMVIEAIANANNEIVFVFIAPVFKMEADKHFEDTVAQCGTIPDAPYVKKRRGLNKPISL
jgi:hypothetical protein